jgi:urease accessory protein UreH
MSQILHEPPGADPACALRGGAELTFCQRRSATVLASARVEAPMKLVRTFALADGRLVVPLITLGPGLCGGDVCTIDVHVEAGARVIVTNTAATRVLGMADGMEAVQRVRLTADRGAHLEYYPGLGIPFPDSAFVQEIDASAARDARLGILETWALGRAARDEYLRFRLVRSHTTVRVDGTLIHADATRLEPRTTRLAGAGVLDRRRYLVSGFWYGADLSSAGRDHTDRSLQTSGTSTDPDRSPDDPSRDLLVAFGQSAPGQVFLRALGNDGQALDRMVRDALARVADAWRVTPLRLERFRC